MPGTSIDELVSQIAEQRNGSVDAALVRRAYEFAAQAHGDTKRLTGDPFISHPLAVAEILTELGMDDCTIAAGLLHDVIEDCQMPEQTIAATFSPEIARLVAGVTKLMRLDFGSLQEKRAENLRKMFLAMAEDIRVLIIKLADRLHNLRTLDPFPTQRQKEIASETLQIFAPLAHRLGIWHLRRDLEDRAFRYLEPEVYWDVVRKVDKTLAERQHLVSQVVQQLGQALNREAIVHEISGRPKHLYSIWRKMQRDEIDIDRIHDLTAIRVLCNTVGSCYHALAVVHNLWMPIPEEFTDLIAKPKANRYRSLHTKVLGPNNEPLEVQIRTWVMHQEAEFGIAAHWKYKEGAEGDKGFEEKLIWLRQLLELQSDHSDPDEYLESLKHDLFHDEVFVFTPKGDVIDLPADSTPVDFAYRVHTQIGHHCTGARVNGRLVPLNHKLKNGDICEVLTTKSSAGPKRDWLEFVRTPHAKERIRSFLRKQSYEENVGLGRERLEREAQAVRLDLGRASRLGTLEKAAQHFKHKAPEDLYAAIGYGDLSAEAVINRLAALVAEETKGATPGLPRVRTLPAKRRPGAARHKALPAVSTRGVDDVLFRLSQCCAPVPGDSIIGYVTRGRGVAVHRTDCRNIAQYLAREPDRIIEVDWTKASESTYQAEIVVEAHDRVGLLKDVSALVSEKQINIDAANLSTGKDHRARINLVLSIPHAKTLADLMAEIAGLNHVIRVHRVGG